MEAFGAGKPFWKNEDRDPKSSIYSVLICECV